MRNSNLEGTTTVNLNSTSSSLIKSYDHPAKIQPIIASFDIEESVKVMSTDSISKIQPKESKKALSVYNHTYLAVSSLENFKKPKFAFNSTASVSRPVKKTP